VTLSAERHEGPGAIGGNGLATAAQFFAEGDDPTWDGLGGQVNRQAYGFQISNLRFSGGQGDDDKFTQRAGIIRSSSQAEREAQPAVKTFSWRREGSGPCRRPAPARRPADGFRGGDSEEEATKDGMSTNCWTTVARLGREGRWAVGSAVLIWAGWVCGQK